MDKSPLAFALGAAAGGIALGALLHHHFHHRPKMIETKEMLQEADKKLQFCELPDNSAALDDYVLKGSLKGLLKKVNHYSIVVKDLAQTEWFYCHLLGFQRLARPDLPREGLWLWLGNIQLHVILGPREEIAHRQDGLVCHLSFETHCSIKVAKELANMHYPFDTVAPSFANRGILQYFIRDPDGYYIEICDCQRLMPYVFANGKPPKEEDRILEYDEHGSAWNVVGAACKFVEKARNNVQQELAVGNPDGKRLMECKLAKGRLSPEAALEVIIDPVKYDNLVRRLKAPRDVLNYHGITKEDVSAALKLYNNDVPQAVLYMCHELKPSIIKALDGIRDNKQKAMKEALMLGHRA